MKTFLIGVAILIGGLAILQFAGGIIMMLVMGIIEGIRWIANRITGDN